MSKENAPKKATPSDTHVQSKEKISSITEKINEIYSTGPYMKKIPQRGEIWDVDLPVPQGSEPAFDRPVLVMQSNDFNVSNVSTIICLCITKSIDREKIPGNILLLADDETNLEDSSIVSAYQIITISKKSFKKYRGKISDIDLTDIEAKIRMVLAV
jgi:mRNA interferase MazF